MPEQAVVNASPLICLSKINALELLGSLYRQVIIPEAVLLEVQAGESGIELINKLKTFSWIKIVRVESLDSDLVEWDLGAGETSVLVWARRNPRHELLMDDRAASRCARLYGLSTRGTLGILLLAKEKQKLSEVKRALEALIQAGCWIAPSLRQRVLAMAGETE